VAAAGTVTKDDAETAKLLAEARKTNAEAVKAEVQSIVPGSLPGDTIDVPAQSGPSPLGAVASLRALDQVVAELSRRVSVGSTPVWIVPMGYDLKLEQAHQLMTAQVARLDQLVTTANGVLEEPGTSALTPGTSSTDGGAPDAALVGAVTLAVGVAAAAAPLVAGLFATTTTIRHGSLPIPFSALTATLAAALRHREPGRPVAIAGAAFAMTGALVDSVNELQSRRDGLAAGLVDFSLEHPIEQDGDTAEASERLAALKELMIAEVAKGGTPSADDRLAAIGAAARAVAQFRRDTAAIVTRRTAVANVVTVIDEFLLRVTTPGPDGTTALALAAEKDARSGAEVLEVEVAYAGGESRWENRAARKDVASHSGSVAVSYRLTNGGDSSMLSSGIIERSVMGQNYAGTLEMEWS
jgi:hypothetical protein